MKQFLSSLLLAACYVAFGGVAIVLRLLRWQRSLVDRHIGRCLPHLIPSQRQEVAAGFVGEERRGHYVVQFGELLPDTPRPEPEQLLCACVRALERHVRAQPAQYLWAYNRWKREKPLYA